MTKYIFNNEEYTSEQVQDAAKQSGVDIDTYIKETGLEMVSEDLTSDIPNIEPETQGQPVEKPKAVVEGTVPAAADTDLQSENGSSEPVNYNQYSQEDLERFGQRFKQGKFREDQRAAYDEYKATGLLNESLLPQKYSRPLNPETGKEFTALEWMKNSISNIDIMDEKSSDFWKGEGNLDLASASIARKLFGKEAVEKAVAVDAADGSTFWTDGLSEKELQKGIERNKELEAKYKQTASMVEGLKEADPAQFVAGAFNGLSQVYSSLKYAVKTLGPVGFFTDFYADNYVAVNEIEASKKGVEIKELVEAGEDEVVLPLVTAYTQSLAESIGLGAIIGKGAKKKVVDTVLKTVTGKSASNSLKAQAAKEAKQSLLKQAGKGAATEVPTELYQSAAEVYATTLTKTDDKLEALSEAAGFIFSEEGAEVALQSAVGGGGGRLSSIGGQKALKALKEVRAAVDPKATEAYVNELSDLNSQLNVATDPDVIDGIKSKIKATSEKLDSLVTRGNGIVSNMSSEELSEVTKMSELTDLQLGRVRSLNAKKKAGNISQEEYVAALDGYKNSFIEAKNRIKGIVEEAEQRAPEDVSERTVKNADAINNAYAKDPSTDTFFNVVIPNTQDLVDGITNKMFRENPEFKESGMTKQDFKNQLTTGDINNPASSLFGLYESFNPDKGQLLTTYLSRNLENRAKRIIDTKIGKQATVGGQSLDTQESKELAADEVEIKISSVKGPRFAKKLGLSDELVNKARNAAKKALSTARKVDDKKFLSDIVNTINSEIFDDIRNLIPKPKEREAFMEQICRYYMGCNAPEFVS